MNTDDLALELRSNITDLLDKFFPIGQVTIIPADPEIFKCIWSTGTYVIYSKAEIIYVGVSDNVGLRLLSHYGNKSERAFGDEMELVSIIRFEKWEQAEGLESVLINRYRPKHNRAIPPICNYLYRFPPKEASKYRAQIFEIAAKIRRLSKDAIELPEFGRKGPSEAYATAPGTSAEDTGK